MPSIAPLPKTILVVGTVQAIHDDFKAFGKRHTIKYIANNSRQQIIKDIKRVANDGPVDILFFMDGSLKSKPINEEVFNPLLPHLTFVSGIGAGFDHIRHQNVPMTSQTLTHRSLPCFWLYVSSDLIYPTTDDPVDVDFLERHQIYYSNTPKAVSYPTATTATMLILETVRAASQAEMGVRRGEWRGLLQPTPDTRGLVVGILGMGTIGKIVCQQVQAFGMNVIYHNRNQLPFEEEHGAQYVSFEELLQYSDVISIHCPLTPQTRKLISDPELARMKNGVFIVNTSRGAVIDENALVRAMESGRVARVGLDVFEKEPAVHPYLMKSDRATLLPHWGTSTTRTAVDVEKEGLANIVAYLNTGVPNTPVNHPFD